MIELFVAGDVVNYRNSSGHILGRRLSEVVANADYSVCNFEAPVQGSGAPQPKSGSHHAQRIETISGLRSQGFDLLLLANNHIMDYGPEALRATVETAELAGIQTIGAGLTAVDAYEPLVARIQDYQVGIINAGEAQFGVIPSPDLGSRTGYAWINSSAIDRNIIALRSQCDFVLVLAHAGLEYYSVPQPEWRERYKHFCDLGADVVIGSHPHVPQGYERHNGSLIFYSLGNLYFDSENFRLKPDYSYSLRLWLSADKEVTFQPVFHHKTGAIVDISEVDDKIDLDSLRSMLDDGYVDLVDLMSVEQFRLIKKHLRTSLNGFPFDPNPVSSIARAVRRIFRGGSRLDKELLLLHLLRNEAYYFAARRALEVATRDRLT